MFCLTDWQPVPVNFWLCPVHTPSVWCHLSHGKLYVALRVGDLSYNTLAVCCPSTRKPFSHYLLQHPRPECACLACHGLRLREIWYQSIPAEYANEHVQGSPKLLRILQSHHTVLGIEESQPTPYHKPHYLLSNQLVLSGSSPRWEKLISGYHVYPLKGLNLRYMYCSQK